MPHTSEVKISQPGTDRWSAGLVQVAAAYLAVGVLVCWPLPLRMATHMQGSPVGDSLLNAWTLSWDADRLLHGLHGVWQAPHFYPANDTLAWSEHLLGIAFFTAPLQWVTGNAVLTYNVALIASVALAGVGMYLLVLELTGRRDAAWVAGLLFACLPYRAGHIGHLQVLMSGWMPLALAALHRFLRTGSRPALGGFAAAFVLQALSNGYFLFFLSVPVALVVIWHSVQRPDARQPVGRVMGGLVVAAVAILLALAPVIVAYQRVKHDQGFARTPGEMAMFSATPSAFVSAAPTQLWARWLPSGASELNLFPGLTLIALVFVGLARSWRVPGARLYALIALASTALALGPFPDVGFGRLPTGPYAWLVAWVPGMDGLRVPARVVVVLYLALSVLAGYGVSWVLDRLARRTGFALIAALTLVGLAEGRSGLALSRVGREVNPAPYEWLAKQPVGPMLELPIGDTAEASQYLWATRLHRNRIVNGYSGSGWALQDLLGGAPSSEPSQADELLRAARAIGLRYVVIHPELYDDADLSSRMVAALTNQTAHIERVVHLGATVMVLRPAAVAVPPDVADTVLPLAECGVEGSDSPFTVARAIDGDVNSRWLTTRPQAGDEWLAVRCRDTRVLTSIELLVNRRSYSDYPRRLTVDVSADGVSFSSVWEGGVVAELAVSVARSDRPTAIRISVPATPFRAVRLRQTGRTSRRWFWSVDELRLRGR